MLRALKYIVSIIVVVIIAIIIALVVLTHVVDPNRFKPTITKHFREATGRQLVLQGPLSWSLFPLGVTINSATVGNKPGFGDKPFLTVEHASVYARLLPLIVGRVEAAKVSLRGLDLNLMTAKNGDSNWRFDDNDGKAYATAQSATAKTVSAQTNRQDQAAKTSESKSSHNGWRISIPDVDARNINITWDDAVTGRHVEIKNLTLSAQGIAPANAFPLRGSFDIDSTLPQFAGSVTFNTRLSVDPKRHAYQVRRLKCTGDVRAAGIPQQKMTFGLAGSGEMTTRHAELKSFVVSLNQDKMDIEASADYGTDKPTRAKFEIESDRFDLDPALALAQALSPGDDNKYAAALPKRRQPITSRTADSGNTNTLATHLRRLDLQGSVDIKQLIVHRAKIQNLVAKAQSSDGRLTLNPVTATLYQGQYNGDIVVDATGNPLQINAKQRLNGVDMQALLSDMYDFKRLSGIASMRSDLSTGGDNAEQMTQNLQGNLAFNMGRGTMQGLDVLYYWHVLTSLLKKQAPPPKPQDGQTQFTSLSATATVNRGIMRTDDLKFAAPAVHVLGAGNVNLPQRQVDMLLKVSGSEKDSQGRLQADGATLPIRVRGPFSDVKFTPDYQAVLRNINPVKHIGDKLMGNDEKAGQEGMLEKGLQGLKNIFR